MVHCSALQCSALHCTALHCTVYCQTASVLYRPGQSTVHSDLAVHTLAHWATVHFTPTLVYHTVHFTLGLCTSRYTDPLYYTVHFTLALFIILHTLHVPSVSYCILHSDSVSYFILQTGPLYHTLNFTLALCITLYTQYSEHLTLGPISYFPLAFCIMD